MLSVDVIHFEELSKDCTLPVLISMVVIWQRWRVLASGRGRRVIQGGP
jgi:hypothetical protein